MSVKVTISSETHPKPERVVALSMVQCGDSGVDIKDANTGLLLMNISASGIYRYHSVEKLGIALDDEGRLKLWS